MVHKEVLVIGAGQCGLAAGRYLQKKGTDFLILEKNKHIGDNWRKRYESLTLFTPASLSALPELPMAIAPKSRPNKNQMADYLTVMLSILICLFMSMRKSGRLEKKTISS